MAAVLVAHEDQPMGDGDGGGLHRAGRRPCRRLGQVGEGKTGQHVPGGGLGTELDAHLSGVSEHLLGERGEALRAAHDKLADAVQGDSETGLARAGEEGHRRHSVTSSAYLRAASRWTAYSSLSAASAKLFGPCDVCSPRSVWSGYFRSRLRSASTYCSRVISRLS